ncbi:GLUG motif-containing protein [Halobellus rufus]|uniref:GLUG motif-containing protein n=1 Tax=Halobellus rufus TaxID=1448860 RepID=UPI0009DE7F70|nr:GLUG motif-containing protein [Halobellus rufus]
MTGGITRRNGRKQRLPVFLVGIVIGLVLLVGVGFVGPVQAASEAPVCSTVTMEGSGTAEDPFQVETLDQLQCLGETPGTSLGFGDYYELQNDIDASETASWNDGAGFEPIASSDDFFYGTFDGNGFVISNLYIDRPNRDEVGLFGYLFDLRIGNVSLESVNITGGEETGGLLGENSGGTVSNASVTGAVSGGGETGGLVGANSGEVTNSSATASVDGDDSTGGLVGFSTDTVRNSSAAGSVNGSEQVGGLVGYSRGDVHKSSATGDVNGSERVGGLVGRLDGTTTESHASGDATGSDSYVGGLIGINNVGDVSESYATGSVTGESRLGGFVGRNLGEISDAFAAGVVDNGQDAYVGGFAGDNDGTITDSYWDSERSDFSTGVGDSVGGTGPGDVNELFSTTDMQGSKAETELGDLFDSGSWTTVAGDYLDLVNNPRTLSTRHYDDPSGTEMDTIIDDMETDGGDTIVTSDKALAAINRAGLADDYRLGLDIDASGTDEWNSGAGWYPLGFGGDQFSGSFDGDGHVITGLYIERTADDVGLFGTATGGATIGDVGVELADITGDVRVGALVGNNTGGSVRTSHMTGTVDGKSEVGGLIGRTTDGGLVTTSYSAGSVTGSGTEIGGLLGNNTGGSTVSESYATGTVTGGTNVGGLVGQNDATVTGGYAIGRVSGTDTGGAIGSNAGSVESLYWNTETTEQSKSAGSAGRYGLATDRMIGLNATVGLFELDFETAWQPAITRDGYPVLASDSEFTDDATAFNGLVVGDGSADDPFEVSTVYELQLVSTRLGEGDSFELTRNIDASLTAEWFDEGSGPQGFEPLGNATVGFSGTFDGNGYAITDLIINRSSDDGIGLFGHVGSNGNVTNVRLKSANVTGRDSIGGVVGTNTGDVRESSVDGKVHGDQRVGGVVGDNDGDLRNSSVTARVNGTDYVGGLVGEGRSGSTLTQSYATGAVNAVGNQIGGAIGRNNGAVTMAAATGAVDGDRNVGGLVGRNLVDGDVRQSYATGGVLDSRYVGGLVGFNDQGSVKDAFATGDVDGQNAGGLVGWNNDGEIRQSYAVGRVNGTSSVGGLVGYNSPSGTIEDSYWDNGTTNQSVGVNSAGGAVTDLVGFGTVGDDNPASEMQGVTAVDSMSNLDFANTWAAVDEYPLLTWSIDELNLTIAADNLTAGESTDATVTLTLVDDTTTIATTTSDYSSNDTSVSTADTATIRARAAGTALLTAEVGGATDTAALAVTAAPSRPLSGGGGSSPPPALELRVTDQSTVEAEGGRAGDVVRISEATTGTNASLGERGTVGVDALSIELANDRDFWVSVETFEGGNASGDVSRGQIDGGDANESLSTVSTTFESETRTLSAGYVTVTHNLEPADVTSATFEFSVRSDRLDELGVSPDSVTLYRQSEGWMALPTEHVGTTGSQVRFEAVSPGFSSFAIGTGEPLTTVAEVSQAESEILAGDVAAVTATVENRGEITAEHTVDLTANGETVASETVALEPGESGEVTLSFRPSVGEYDLTVDEMDAGSVAVSEPPAPDVTTPADAETERDGSLGFVLSALVVLGLIGGGLWWRQSR